MRLILNSHIQEHGHSQFGTLIHLLQSAVRVTSTKNKRKKAAYLIYLKLQFTLMINTWR